MTAQLVSEGRIPGPLGSTWWRVTGDLKASTQAGFTPLVVVHGGPGMTHDYLLSIAELAGEGRAVVHYDQIGSGRSAIEAAVDSSTWTVQLFLDELDRVLTGLGISESYHLLGQSWGGMLAAEHAIRQPKGLRALILANSPASMPLWKQGVDQLRAGLPAEVQDVLDRHEAADTTDSAEYAEAGVAFNDRHFCRVVPNPPDVVATFDYLAADSTVYVTMVGPNEFHIIGTLRDWDITAEAHSIVAKTLLINGAHDEATDLCVQPFADAIPDVRWVKFDESSHVPHVEETERYLSVVSRFLAESDPRERRTAE